MPSEAVALYGTAEPAAPGRRLSCGALSLTLMADSLRALCWHGIELVRGVAWPIRDPDWGTLETQTLEDVLDATPERLTWRRRFATPDGAIAGTLDLVATAQGTVEIGLDLVAGRDVALNRAGFTVLHPIRELAGAPLDILHPDGRREAGRFPARIAPSQPARDLAGLAYGIGGCRVQLTCSGEVFEMEDQRNWSDASYKTYCRPLSRPFPFQLAAGARVSQKLVFAFTGSAPAASAAVRGGLELAAAQGERVPEMALALEAGWRVAAAGGSEAAPLSALRRLVRLDLEGAEALPVARSLLQDLAGPFDLELVTTDDAAALPAQIAALARLCAETGRSPDHVLALPAAYLRSYQPDGRWPAGASPEAAVAAARAAFPAARIGGGMLTNFTEFNRRPPRLAGIDYVSHGSSAIVHAADDRSVFETLEALPQIFASARALAPDKPYRLGLISIGMRSNPYGREVIANPQGLRRPMAIDDPRSGALSGAAWLVGVAAATFGAGVELLTLAAPAGPFGLVRAAEAGWNDGRRLTPAYHVVAGLGRLAGAARLAVRLPDADLYAIAGERDGAILLLLANGSPEARTVRLPGPARLSRLDVAALDRAARDPDWIDHAAAPCSPDLALPPHAVAFLSLPPEALR